MKNFVQEGEVVTLTAPSGGVSSGDGLVVGNLFGVCTTDAAETEEVEVALTGVFELPKATGQINEGARVWWHTTNGNVVNASSAGLYPIGVAVKAAGTSDATCGVRLDGVGTAAV